MATPDLTEDPVRRQRYRFKRRGDVLHVEVWADPGGEVPEHLHPSMEERFEVVEGEFRFKRDGEKVVAGPGDRVVVPAGAWHRYENIGDGTGHLKVEAEPGAGLQEILEEGAALARAGKYTRHGIPRGPRAALQVAEFAERHRGNTVLKSPPRALQALLLAPLARLERRLQEREAGSSGR